MIGWVRSAKVAVLAGLALSCTTAGLQPEEKEPPTQYDNLLTIKAEFCTRPDAAVEFPIKVLFVIDQSTSFQFTDTENVRFTALNQFIDRLLVNPLAEVGFVGFANWSRDQTFTRDRMLIAPFIDPASGLGPATDYQGALATARRVLERDMMESSQAERARTRYIVIFMSDGVPGPRCNPGCEDGLDNCTNNMDDDGDLLTDAADPNCIDPTNQARHPENVYVGCNDFDASELDEDLFVDLNRFQRCPGYNTYDTILSRVREIVGLEDTYSVGDVVLNSVLILNPGIDPMVADLLLLDDVAARALVSQMAEVGGGTYRDANVGVGDTSFLDFDIRTLEAPQVLVSMGAINTHAMPRAGTLEVDRDQDGLSDDAEAELGLKITDPQSEPTAMLDPYSDGFEQRLRDRGFDPMSPQPCYDFDDLDRDGLVNCAETEIETDPRSADTDQDGIIDSVEINYGLDPTRDDARDDPDFDGATSYDEVYGGTDPIVGDSDRAPRAQYGLSDLGVRNVVDFETGREEERHCYQIDIHNLQLVQTPLPASPGLNRIFLYASDQPAQVSGAGSATHIACIDVIYQGPGLKDPASGELDLTDRAWNSLLLQIQDSFDAIPDRCEWFDPATYERETLAAAIRSECVDEPFLVGPYAYDRDRAQQLLRQYIAVNGAPNLPNPAPELFVPIETFDPNMHCHQPARVQLLLDLFDHVADACSCPNGDSCCDPFAP